MSATENVPQKILYGTGVAGCIMSWRVELILQGYVRLSRIEGSAKDQPVLMRPRRVEARRCG